MCALLKTVEYHYTVIANEQIEVYTDEALTNPAVAYYFGNIKRGESTEAKMWVKNLGESVNLDITWDTPDAVVTPDTLALATDEVKEVSLTISVPWDAVLEDVSGKIEFVTAT